MGVCEGLEQQLHDGLRIGETLAVSVSRGMTVSSAVWVWESKGTGAGWAGWF